MEILAILPTSTSGYSIKYYKMEDALAENVQLQTYCEL
jgi:hypothetical protein